MRDPILPAPPEWLESLQRTLAQATEAARPLHEALTRAFAPPAWVQDLERSTAQITKLLQPYQETVARIAEQTKALAGYDQLTKSLTRYQDTTLGINENLRKLAGYDTLANVTSTARLLEDMLKATPGLNAFRPHLAALDQLRAQPFLEYVRHLDVPALEKNLRNSQPALQRAEAHAVAQALTEDAEELAATLTDDEDPTLLASILVLWQRLRGRLPTDRLLTLISILLAVITFLRSEAGTTRMETKIDRTETKVDRLGKNLDRHETADQRRSDDLQRLIKETLRSRTPQPGIRTARVQHAISLRATPSNHARSIARLTRGERVTILESGRHWAHIALPSKTTGWVRKKYLRTTPR